MMRFPNQNSCEAAAQWYRVHNGTLKVDYVCLQDLAK